MKRAPFILVILLFTQLCACGSLLNPIFDERKVFSGERDSEVGDNINWLLKHNARYSCFHPKNQSVCSLNHVVAVAPQEISEYQFRTPHCSWALEVNEKTNKVLAWKYLGDPSNCKSKKFFEGAW